MTSEWVREASSAVRLDPLAVELLAGGAGGALGVAVGQPFDFVKVRLQSQTLYSGPWDCLRKVAKQEGLFGVYRGIMPPVLNSFLLNAIMFGGYGQVQGWMRDSDVNPVTRSFVAGSYAGLISCAALVPFDVVKCQMQVDCAGGRPAQFSNGVACARAVIAREGVTGMYRGGIVTIFRDSPTTGAYFVAYEALEHELPRLSPYLAGECATFWAGGISGMLAWTLAYPFDVVKTYLMTLPLSSQAHERTISHAVQSMYARNGMAAFYRGLGTCLARAFPVNAVTFLVYKRLREILQPAELRPELRRN
ncbi:mitochondrial carrier domain-containing protein [Pavlovales sp. CCMP2436]|nr:mitochondrial carrier domain-containing protein [Pavlovales sp. CCMP2436]|mmetsp:Transcript_3593/g.9033  ORF Transcript_3593/g.9033 Transcript_3593/m.9033 type:complete len:306 (+) Transcript_3593:86-1003(+)